MPNPNTTRLSVLAVLLCIPINVYAQTGIASWYGPGFYGCKTASGAVYTGKHRTLAHRTMPLGSEVRIKNLNTGKSRIAIVTDRGPYVKGRIADVSPRLAHELGLYQTGTAKVKITRLN